VTEIPEHEPGAAAARSPGAADAHNLQRRVVSAAVLSVVAILTAYLGGWVFLGVWLIAAGAVLWEWTILVQRQADPRVLAPGWAALLAAIVLAAAGRPAAATGTMLIGAVLAGGTVALLPQRVTTAAPPLWAAGGVVYAGIVMLGPALLRGDAELGFVALLFVFAIVWTADIFAFFTGRAVGGPLLWPQVSPKKTWAGAFGGLIGGVAAGCLVAYASGVGGLVIVGALAVVLSILAQGGDLFESAVKRRFGVKDASKLIPGHGGAMDRLDGFLVAALAAVLIGILHQGTAAPARGLLVW
jgi:phosphatidate cytidylyltransferase